MPKKIKEELENTEETKKVTKRKNVTSSNAKVSNKTSKSSTKKANSKSSSQAEKDNIESVSEKKKTAKKSTSAKLDSKKTTQKKATTKKTSKEKKVTNTKKTATKKTNSSAKKVTRRKTTSKDVAPKVEVLEYYDLPYRYNQTVVKVLAQTPTTLFIYWDVSDEDRNTFVEQYGNDFFNNTKPVLVIHNDTMHYAFEIEIDDFANSWYLHVNDSNCEYRIELGRRPKYYNEERHIDIPNNYMYITSSNIIDAPNDHILFDKDFKTVYFKDVKTNIITSQDITSLSFIRNMGKIYNLYDLQSDYNEKNWLSRKHWQLDLKNPSSSNPSSTFK